jgi:hypothetical protein
MCCRSGGEDRFGLGGIVGRCGSCWVLEFMRSRGNRRETELDLMLEHGIEELGKSACRAWCYCVKHIIIKNLKRNRQRSTGLTRS